jgi:hypothetical protein
VRHCAPELPLGRDEIPPRRLTGYALAMADTKYDPPRIEQRTDIGPGLIGLVPLTSVTPNPNPSAAFRPL